MTVNVPSDRGISRTDGAVGAWVPSKSFDFRSALPPFAQISTG